MKNYFKFLVMSPLLFAVLCEEDTDICGYSDPEAYVVNVENSQETYAVGETFWINSEIASTLSNACNNDETTFVNDNLYFRDAIFILKLNNGLTNLNAEVTQDFNVVYDIGEAYNGDYCLEALEFLPQLSADSQTYNYRLGLSINQPGDYCIVSALNEAFTNVMQQNNPQVFEPYDTLDNKIKFFSCGNTYTRYGTENNYFFKVQ